MSTNLQLYWLTEGGCHLGTPLQAENLDPAIREKVLQLAVGSTAPLTLYLPFFDRRESRRRAEILRSVRLVREGDVIRSLPPTENAGLRDLAAMLLAAHPAWKNAPDERQRAYFQTWQRVSLALQRGLREWIPELYFQDAARYEDREAAYPLVVYAASRVCRGRPRTEFTYDIGDAEILPRALHMVGRALRMVLARIEQRLYETGRPALARRYGPMWAEDVMRAVQKKPRPLIALLADEAILINAVVNLGTSHGLGAVRPFAKNVNTALRNLCGEDMRALAPRILAESTKALTNEKQAEDAIASSARDQSS